VATNERITLMNDTKTETEGAPMLPSVIRVPSSGSKTGCKRYRLEGGTIADSWKAKEDGAWCEVSIWSDGPELSSYGGQVWPMAWPALFEALPSSAQLGSGRVQLTDLGREVFAAADLAAFEYSEAAAVQP
jgi:hypothetical protein